MPLLCLPFPMIRNKQELALAHNKAYETVKAYLDRGQSVGMLTIGDPAIYSTYLYMHKRALNDLESDWEKTLKRFILYRLPIVLRMLCNIMECAFT